MCKKQSLFTEFWKCVAEIYDLQEGSPCFTKMVPIFPHWLGKWTITLHCTVTIISAVLSVEKKLMST